MKTAFKKLISTVLAAALAIICACTLFACNKDKERVERDAKLRAENVATVKDTVLNAMDESWRGELDDTSVAALNNAGDYISASGWADMVMEVLKKSSLQTAKLTALKNAVTSQDGKKLLKDFEGNAELLIPLMRSADFTATDISNLTYDLLCALIGESRAAIDKMTNRLNAVKTTPSIASAAKSNIDINLLNLAVIKERLAPTEQEKTTMLAALAEAKAPLGEIVAFAYKMSIGSITDNIFNALFGADGALADITDGEISTVINAMITNASILKNALDDAAIQKLNRAIALIIDKFDKNVGISTIYDQIVQYSKYSYMVIDAIPSLCDVLVSAGGVFDSALISELRQTVLQESNSKSQLINSAIIMAKVLLAASEDFDEAGLCAAVDKVGAQVNGEYKKTIPIFALDVALNLASWYEDFDQDSVTGKHPQIISQSDFDVVLGTVLLTFGLDNFNQEYLKYKNGTVNSSSAVITAAGLCGFKQLGIENPYNPVLVSEFEAWYSYYAVTGVELATQKAVEVCGYAVNDIKAFISDFYAPSSDSKQVLQTIADWQLVSGNLSNEEYAAYEEQIFKSDMVGLLVLIQLLLGN